MKQRSIILIFALILLSAFLVIAKEVTIKETPSNVGDTKKVEINKDSGTLTYQEVKDRTIVGFQKEYKVVDIVQSSTNESNITLCDGDKLPSAEFKFKNTTAINKTCNCSIYHNQFNRTFQITQEDKLKKGDPVYAYSKIEKIKYDGKEYDFNDKGCWVCSNYLCCLSRNDGYSDNRGVEFKCDQNQKCIIRSGETGATKNLVTGEVTYIRGGHNQITVE